MYQNLTQKHDDNADEASLLLLTVAGGVSATKKTHGVSMRAMIATCFVLLVLGTLAVLYSGGSGSGNTNRTDGSSEALLLDHNQAAPYVYDPKRYYCNTDTDNPGKYCWFPTDKLPCGNWKGEDGHGYNDCGPLCALGFFDHDDGCIPVEYVMVAPDVTGQEAIDSFL